MTNKTKKSLLLGLGVVCLSVAISGALIPKTSTAQAELVGGGEFLEYYVKNEILEIPDVSLSHDGVNYAAEHCVTFPDGKTLTKDDTVTLSQAGEYTVLYSANVGTKYLTAERRFSVKQATYETEGVISYIKEGIHEKYDNVEGLNVTLFQGESFVFNKPINLNDFDGVPFFKMQFTPDVAGELEAGYFYFELIDAYDAEKTMTVRVKADQDHAGPVNSISYSDAKTTGQDYTGLQKRAGGISIDGVSYTCAVNHAKYGCYGRPSLSAVYQVSWNAQTGAECYPNVGNQEYGLAYDVAKKQIYNSVYTTWQDTSKTDYNLITDFDDPNVNAASGVLFDGFTTGEVYFRIYTDKHYKVKANFSLTSIGNYSFEEKEFVDVEKPTITIDADDEENLPAACYGKNYLIPSATARGNMGVALEVETFAYFEYYNEQNRVNVPIVDGRISTDRLGDYYIVYRTQNVNGVKAEKILKVPCVKGLPALTVSLSGKTETAKVGHLTDLAIPSGSSYYGNVEWKVWVASADGRIDVDMENLAFTPEKAGKYTVYYQCADTAEIITESYEITATANEHALFTNEFSFPDFMIIGATYTFPEITSETFVTGAATATTPVVTVLEKTGETTKEVAVTDGTYKVAACDSLEIVCKASDKEGAEVRTFTAKPVNVGYGAELDLSQYFQTVDGQFTAALNNTDIFYQANSTTAKLEFIRLLDVEEISFSFGTYATHTQFSRMNVYLVDSVDESSVAKVTYEIGSGVIKCYVQDALAFTINADVTQENQNIVLSYDEQAKSVSPVIGESVSMPSDFKGFASGEVRLFLEVEGVNGDAGVSISGVGTQQRFTKVKYDLIAPSIVGERLTGYQNINEEVILPGMKAIDTLDTSVTFTVRVLYPSKTVVKTVDGVELDNVDARKDYCIKLTEYGEYTVLYTATDSSDNLVPFRYVFKVVDQTAPTLSIENAQTKGKVGDTFLIPTVMASDNLSETVEIFTYVYAPDGVMNIIGENGFKATVAGRYTVWIYAVDEAGNIAKINYIVDVTEGEN